MNESLQIISRSLIARLFLLKVTFIKTRYKSEFFLLPVSVYCYTTDNVAFIKQTSCRSTLKHFSVFSKFKELWALLKLMEEGKDYRPMNTIQMPRAHFCSKSKVCANASLYILSFAPVAKMRRFDKTVLKWCWKNVDVSDVCDWWVLERQVHGRDHHLWTRNWWFWNNHSRVQHSLSSPSLWLCLQPVCSHAHTTVLGRF